MKVYLKNEVVLLTAIGISSISALILLFLVICFSLITTTTKEGGMLVGLTLPSIISLYILPKWCRRKLNIKSDFIEIPKRSFVALLFFIIFSILYGVMFCNEFESIIMMVVVILHYAVVGLVEEFTYRKFILEVLELKYKLWISIMISAFMFSFILHINGDLIVNLFIRFPMGLIFGYIAKKTNSIAYTSVLHTIYDLVILIL